ncbi:hypothetical protein GCM10028778_10300 [Barrientosiimonas marina]
MRQLIWDIVKVFIIFTICTFFFYFSLHYMHTEYEQIHRYDPPEGPSVKVLKMDDRSFIDRLNLFLRLGE